MATHSHLSMLVEGLWISSLLLLFVLFFSCCDATSRGIESMDPVRVALTSDASTDPNGMVSSSSCAFSSCSAGTGGGGGDDQEVMHPNSDRSVADWPAGSRNAIRIRDSGSERVRDTERLRQTESEMRENEEMSASSRMRENEQMRDSSRMRENEQMRDSSRMSENEQMRDSSASRMRENEQMRDSGRMTENEKMRDSSRMRENGQMRDSNANRMRDTERMSDSADWTDSERLRDTERMRESGNAVKNMERMQNKDSGRAMSGWDSGRLKNSEWTGSAGLQKMRIVDIESESMRGSDQRMRDSERMHMGESSREWEASRKMRDGDRFEASDRMGESDIIRGSNRMGESKRMRDSERMGQSDRMRDAEGTRDSDKMGDSKRIWKSHGMRGSDRINFDESNRLRDSDKMKDSDKMRVDPNSMRGSDRLRDSVRSWDLDRTIDSEGRRDSEIMNTKDSEMLRDSERMRNLERRTIDSESIKDSESETMRDSDRKRTPDRRRDLESTKDSGKMWAAAERSAEHEKARESRSQMMRVNAGISESHMQGRINLGNLTKSDSSKTADTAILGGHADRTTADSDRMSNSKNMRNSHSRIGDTERELPSTKKPLANFCHGTTCQSARDVEGMESGTRGHSEVMHWSSRRSTDAGEITGTSRLMRDSERMDTSAIIDAISCRLNGADCHISPDPKTRGFQPMVTCSDDHCRQATTRGFQPMATCGDDHCRQNTTRDSQSMVTGTCSNDHCHQTTTRVSQPMVTCSDDHCRQTTATTEEHMGRRTPTEKMQRGQTNQEPVRSERISSERRAAGSEVTDAEMRKLDKQSTAAGNAYPRVDTKAQDSQSARNTKIDGSRTIDSAREMNRESLAIHARSASMLSSSCIHDMNCRSNREIRHMSVKPRDLETMDLESRRPESQMMHTGSKMLTQESTPRRGMTMDRVSRVDSENEIQSEMMRSESNEMRSPHQVMGADTPAKMSDSTRMGSMENSLEPRV